MDLGGRIEDQRHIQKGAENPWRLCIPGRKFPEHGKRTWTGSEEWHNFGVE